MNRRAFLGNLIGGVAATAAVRTWPFRVYSLPPSPHEEFTKIQEAVNRLRQGPVDMGFHNFEYAGIPIIEDTDCPPGYMYLLNDKYITRPETVKRWLKLGLPKLKLSRCEAM